MTNWNNLSKTANSISPIMRVHTRACGKIVGKRYVPENSSSYLSHEILSTFRFRRVFIRPRDRKTQTNVKTTVTNRAVSLPGIEWAIVDTVNIQPGFPVTTMQRKNEAREKRERILLQTYDDFHTSHRHQNWVFTLSSRAILEFPLGTRVLFSHTQSTGAPRHDESPCE